MSVNILSFFVQGSPEILGFQLIVVLISAVKCFGSLSLTLTHESLLALRAPVKHYTLAIQVRLLYISTNNDDNYNKLN